MSVLPVTEGCGGATACPTAGSRAASSNSVGLAALNGNAEASASVPAALTVAASPFGATPRAGPLTVVRADALAGRLALAGGFDLRLAGDDLERDLAGGMCFLGWGDARKPKLANVALLVRPAPDDSRVGQTLVSPSTVAFTAWGARDVPPGRVGRDRRTDASIARQPCAGEAGTLPGTSHRDRTRRWTPRPLRLLLLLG